MGSRLGTARCGTFVRHPTSITPTTKTSRWGPRCRTVRGSVGCLTGKGGLGDVLFCGLEGIFDGKTCAYKHMQFCYEGAFSCLKGTFSLCFRLIFSILFFMNRLRKIIRQFLQ